MKPFSNGLTLAEAERLAILAEELGEAMQAVGKVLRHGYESYNPLLANSKKQTNRRHLEKELGDVRFAMIQLCEAGDLEKDFIHSHAAVKRDSIKRWLHHQEEKK